jgi:hypothetical protein
LEKINFKEFQCFIKEYKLVPKLSTSYGIGRHDEGEITFTGLGKLIKRFKQMCLDFVPTSNR